MPAVELNTAVVQMCTIYLDLEDSSSEGFTEGLAHRAMKGRNNPNGLHPGGCGGLVGWIPMSNHSYCHQSTCSTVGGGVRFVIKNTSPRGYCISSSNGYAGVRKPRLYWYGNQTSFLATLLVRSIIVRCPCSTWQEDTSIRMPPLGILLW